MTNSETAFEDLVFGDIYYLKDLLAFDKAGRAFYISYAQPILYLGCDNDPFNQDVLVFVFSLGYQCHLTLRFAPKIWPKYFIPIARRVKSERETLGDNL